MLLVTIVMRSKFRVRMAHDEYMRSISRLIIFAFVLVKMTSSARKGKMDRLLIHLRSSVYGKYVLKA